MEKGPRGLRRGRGARERILSASQQLFRDQGINRTGMDQLCAVAEVSKRTLYQHFTGKDELIAEYLRRFDPDILPGVFDRTDLTPRERLLAAFDVRRGTGLAPVPVHRGGRRNPRPRPPRPRIRPRLQESLCRAVHRYRPRGRRHQPRTARRATGAAAGWRLGPHPGPQHRHLRHRRRHRRRPHRQRHPHGSPDAGKYQVCSCSDGRRATARSGLVDRDEDGPGEGMDPAAAAWSRRRPRAGCRPGARLRSRYGGQAVSGLQGGPGPMRKCAPVARSSSSAMGRSGHTTTTPPGWMVTRAAASCAARVRAARRGHSPPAWNSARPSRGADNEHYVK